MEGVDGVGYLPNSNFDTKYAANVGADADGVNIRASLTVPECSADNELIAGHEMGHGLGATHGMGVMSLEVQDLNEWVGIDAINDIPGRAAIGPNKKLSKENGSTLIGKRI